MSRQKVGLRIEPILDGIVAGRVDGPAATVLDAATELMREFGLRRWTMDDVADRAGLGRTSVYRCFANRDDLLHAVLAREVRTTIEVINQAAAAEVALEDKLVAGAAAGLQVLSGSVVDRLIQTDPSTFLPFLTARVGPLLAIARSAVAAHLRQLDPSMPATLAEEVGEAGARLALSFVLVRETIVPIDDPEALRRLARQLLQAVTPVGAA